ncbi:Aluminum-activated malate transporter 9 [Nymphaea thermarum]|nr:Aluminum-activated malate transporter 9 [Nymphaea thermarum]
MNGKKGSVEIDILHVGPTKVALPDSAGKSFGDGATPCLDLARKVYDFCKEDVNRLIFSLKVGLAVLLVSLLILVRAPYEVFGSSIIWAILTVAIMFEYTVGATFNKGFNRALGSLLAGVLAITIAQIALHAGRVAEPLIIGISIFFIGAVTSFLKQWPSMTPYEYGFRVVLFTFCLIIVSGYRMGNPTRTAMDRLSSIVIGAVVTLLVNVLVFPIWAGEQLHRELIRSFDAVADSLEECVKKYLSEEGSEVPEFEKAVKDELVDEPAFQRCRSILNSASKLDSLANSAKWEPPHGKFSHFFYPWAEYVKVGAILRHCAYEVMALHGCLHSEIQAPYNLRIAFQSEIQDAASHAAELVRSLGKDIGSMKLSLQASLLEKVHCSTEKLQRSIYTHSYLLIAGHGPVEASGPTLAAPDACKHLAEVPRDLSVDTPNGSETCYELMKKQHRKLHSWPSREVDEFEEDAAMGSLLPRMKMLESTTSLSLATFTSLLIEFVARLDHLVDAVNKLGKLANFKN